MLDLDETLVHSSMEKFKSGTSTVELDIMWEGKVSKVFVKLRPGVFEFLKRMTWIYEVVIFTASVSNYATPLIDHYLDTQNYGFYKLFWENCTFKSGFYVKDLSRLGWDLKDIIIVDNLPSSYWMHPFNGIPISSWYDDEKDVELSVLTVFLDWLAYVDDVRDYIKKITFKDKFSISDFQKLFST